MLFDQTGRKPVVARRHRRVRREHRAAGDAAHRFVDAGALALHALPHQFQHGKRAVPLVQVHHARGDSQRLQGAHAADAQQQLLANPRPRVAAIQPGGQLAIFRRVARHVGIEQIQQVAAHRQFPHPGRNLAGARFDRNRDRLAVDPPWPAGSECRRCSDRGSLPAAKPSDVEPLAEIALIVVQPDADQRNAQVRGAFDVVARQECPGRPSRSAPTRAAELGREVGHRPGPQHAGVAGAPGVVATPDTRASADRRS